MGKAGERRMKLSVFMGGDCNYHIAGWRLPDTFADTGMNIQRWMSLAQTMERGKLDMLFIADSIGVPGVDNREALSHNPMTDRLEPFTTLAALSSVTKHIGLAATSATTYTEPFHVARMFASLDYLSGGRAGWNVVTGGNREDALNFSHKGHPEHGDRYDRAEEFVDVVTGLWDSFDEDAFPRDKSSGIYMHPDKMHVLNHSGEHFKVKGPLSVARSPQGRPILIQAGASDPARDLSARIADAVFMSASSFEQAQAFYSDVKARLGRFNRKFDDMLVLPGVVVIVGRTSDEAEEKYEQMNSLLHLTTALALLEQRMGGIDLSSYPLDGPMPNIEGNQARMSNPPALMALAKRENLSLRQLAMRHAAARVHWMVRGTPDHVADQLEHWFINGAADVFNLLPMTVPGSINDFVDLVVPELQRRGLFRMEYEGKTLRENLGLSAPVNRHSQKPQVL